MFAKFAITGISLKKVEHVLVLHIVIDAIFKDAIGPIAHLAP